MRSKWICIGLILAFAVLLFGNLAVGLKTTNDLQICRGANTENCNGRCVNTLIDNKNCGSCGNVCGTKEVCHNGKCVGSTVGKGNIGSIGVAGNRATCTDGRKNGNETDIDCGGSSCLACADGRACNTGTDCSSGVCNSGICQAPTCTDQVKNGNETGVDCGGSCKPCLRRVNLPTPILANPIVAVGPVSQTPTYNFVLDSCRITNTRSVHEDTDYASLGVSVSNAMVGTPQTKSLGNLNNGVHPINLVVGPTPVAADPNIPVAMAFQIVNSGHTDYSTIVDALSAGTGALIDSYLPGAGSATGVVLKYLGGILTANCDGPVAVDKIVTNGQQLAEWTASGQHSVTTYYPGTDSPTGCGSNSEYYVTWHVERVS